MDLLHLVPWPYLIVPRPCLFIFELYLGLVPLQLAAHVFATVAAALAQLPSFHVHLSRDVFSRVQEPLDAVGQAVLCLGVERVTGVRDAHVPTLIGEAVYHLVELLSLLQLHNLLVVHLADKANHGFTAWSNWGGELRK